MGCFFFSWRKSPSCNPLRKIKISCFSWRSAPSLNCIRVVHVSGYVEDFEKPITVRHVVGTASKHFLCSADHLLSFGRQPLAPDAELQPGRVYFLLPLSIFRSDSSPVDLASLANRLTAIAKRGGSAAAAQSHHGSPISGRNSPLNRSDSPRRPIHGRDSPGRTITARDSPGRTITARDSPGRTIPGRDSTGARGFWERVRGVGGRQEDESGTCEAPMSCKVSSWKPILESIEEKSLERRCESMERRCESLERRGN